MKEDLLLLRLTMRGEISLLLRKEKVFHLSKSRHQYLNLFWHYRDNDSSPLTRQLARPRHSQWNIWLYIRCLTRKPWLPSHSAPMSSCNESLPSDYRAIRPDSQQCLIFRFGTFSSSLCTYALEWPGCSLPEESSSIAHERRPDWALQQGPNPCTW